MDGPEYDGRSFLHDDRERGSRGRRPFLLVIYICHLLWFLWVAVSQFFRWLVLSLDREYLNPYGIYLRLQGLALDSAGVLISGFVILVIACVVCGMFCGLLVPGWFLAGRMFAYMRDTLYFDGNGGGL